MTWDYVFVGAGPAALVAATEIARDGAMVLILDAGRTLRRRGCKGLKEHTCTSCAGSGCHVTQGVGGSSAIFGNKACYFPASDGISRLISEADAADIDRRVLEVMGGETERPSSVVALDVSPHRKVYDADVVYRGDYRRVIETVAEAAVQCCALRADTPIAGASTDGALIVLRTEAGEAITARNLVIATGRSGWERSRQWFDALGCDYTLNSPDVGFRIEAPTECFEPSFFYQNDPKYKFAIPGIGSARTFCACRGGAIIPVKHGDAFFADGAFLSADTGRTNIALMVRTETLVHSDEITSWMTRLNARFGQNLFAGEVRLDRSPQDVARALTALVADWPSDQHRALADLLIENVVGGCYVRAFRRSDASIRIFGPSIDLYWPRLKLSEGFRTNVPNVSVIGDATGISRGILQAITSGIAWARAEVRSTSQAPERRLAAS